VTKINRHRQKAQNGQDRLQVGWTLTTLSTQFRSYRAFKVEIYYKY